MKVGIKTQPGERDSKTVTIYVPLFRTVSLGDLLKFVNISYNIIRGQDLSTVTQRFEMTQNLVSGEALQVSKQKARERGADTNANYELAMKDLIYHFLPPKVLQRHKRYLRRDLYNPPRHQDTIFHLPHRRYGQVPREVPAFWSRTTPTKRRDPQVGRVITPEGV